MVTRAFDLSNITLSDPFTFLSALRQHRDVHRKLLSTAGHVKGSAERSEY